MVFGVIHLRSSRKPRSSRSSRKPCKPRKTNGVHGMLPLPHLQHPVMTHSVNPMHGMVGPKAPTRNTFCNTVFNPHNPQRFRTNYGIITPPQPCHPQLDMQLVMQIINQPTLPCPHQHLLNNKTMDMYQTAQQQVDDGNRIAL